MSYDQIMFDVTCEKSITNEIIFLKNVISILFFFWQIGSSEQELPFSHKSLYGRFTSDGW